LKRDSSFSSRKRNPLKDLENKDLLDSHHNQFGDKCAGSEKKRKKTGHNSRAAKESSAIFFKAIFLLEISWQKYKGMLFEVAETKKSGSESVTRV